MTDNRTSPGPRIRTVIVFIAAAASSVFGSAQFVAPPGEDVVATVGGEPIRAREVSRLVSIVGRSQKIDSPALPAAEAQILTELVNRRLILAYARRTGTGPRAGEIDSAMTDFQSQLKAKGQVLAEYLRAQAITEDDLKRQIAWNVTWERFLARYVTEERLQAYFLNHRRDWDGTEISVSHVLLRPSPGARDSAALLKRAQEIRAAIVAGRTTFEEAARRHSSGPSARNNGRLGFIPRHGSMDEAFSRAAFALEQGDISPPVKTPFGVHLIRCNEIRPGKKQLADVRKDLETVLARELLERLSTLERDYTPVAYTGKAPYFKPGADQRPELIDPRKRP